MADRVRRTIKPPPYLSDFQSAGSTSATISSTVPFDQMEIRVVDQSVVQHAVPVPKPKKRGRTAAKTLVAKRLKQTDNQQKDPEIDADGDSTDELFAVEPDALSKETRRSKTPVPTPEDVPAPEVSLVEAAKKPNEEWYHKMDIRLAWVECFDCAADFCNKTHPLLRFTRFHHPTLQKDTASERMVLQEAKFTLAKADLVESQKFVVLRFQEHEASFVSPEELGNGNPIVFHSGFAAYGSVFRVGDIVKGQFRNQNLYTAVIDAIVFSGEEAEEAARRCRTMQKLLTQEHGRNQTDPKQRNKNDRNQISRVATLNSGSKMMPPAPAPSAVQDAARRTAASFTLFQNSGQEQAGTSTQSGVTGFSNKERNCDSLVPEPQYQKQRVGKTNMGKQAPKPHATKEKGNPNGKSKEAGAAKKFGQDKEGSPTTDADDVGNWGFSQNSGASSADGDYVYPYTVKACRKVRLSRSYPVFIDERELYSVVTRCRSRRQLACSLTLHLLGGIRGVRHFYQNKPARHGVSKVHKNLVFAIDEYVHSVKKIGGIPNLPPLRCIGQILNSFLTHYYRSNTEAPQAE